MATTLTHLNLHHHTIASSFQQSLSNPSSSSTSNNNNLINSISSSSSNNNSSSSNQSANLPMTNVILDHSHSHNNNTTTSSRSTDKFCKDCNVMFESNASLEVHLSYHKENLLSRWANQDNNNMDTKSRGANPPSSENNNNPSNNNSSNSNSNNTANGDEHNGGSPFYQQHEHPPPPPHYLPPQYNNNTGDHHMDHGAYRPPFQAPPPVVLGDGHHPYGGGSLSHTHPHLFSPVVGGSPGGGAPPGGGGGGGGGTPSEILDLDSHKVHVYQHQLAAAAAERANFFHRPYLPHLLPPHNPHSTPPSQINNGWPLHPGDFANSNPPTNGFPSDHHLPFSQHSAASHQHHQQPPPPPIVYDISRSNSEPSNSVFHPQPGGAPCSPSLGGYSNNPPPPVSVSAFNDRGYPSDDSSNPPSGVPNVVIRSSSSGAKNSPKRSPGSTTTGKLSLAAGSTSSSSGPSSISSPAGGPPGKTKGWKGGECKRPKTYNCVACNKWFTSSGHLKRHYGTTLHKNSIRQRGENPDEIPPPPVSKGKKSQAQQQQQQDSGTQSSGGTDSMDSTDLATSPPSSNTNSRGIKIESGSGQDVKPRTGGINGNHEESRFQVQNPIPVPSPNSSPYGMIGVGHLQQQQQPSSLSSFSPYSSGSAGQLDRQHHFIPSQSQQQTAFHSYGNPSLQPFSNGFGPGGPHPPISHHENFSVNPPTTTSAMSNANYSLIDGMNPPLPPFSTVGFSHYDPNAFNNQQNELSNRIFSIRGGGPGGGNNETLQPNHQQQQSFLGDSNQNQSPNSYEQKSFESESAKENSPEELRSSSVASLLVGDEDLTGSGCSSDAGGSPNNSSGGESNRDEGVMDVLKCPDCSKTFGRACYLTQHTKSSHSGSEKPFKCQTCGKKFPETSSLSDHVAKHGSDKPYKCALCPKQFNHKTDLRRHLCLHTGEKPFTCPICQKGFIRKDHMNKHSETHAKKKNSAAISHI